MKKQYLVKSMSYTINWFLMAMGLVIFGLLTDMTMILFSPVQIGSPVHQETASISNSMVGCMIVLANPELGSYISEIQQKFNFFTDLIGLIQCIAFAFIGFRLRQIFKDFKNADYFSSGIPGKIRSIAFILMGWALVDFLVRFLPGVFLPPHMVSSSIGIYDPAYLFLAFLGFKITPVILGLIMLILSVVFRYGNNLQEEASLTI